MSDLKAMAMESTVPLVRQVIRFAGLEDRVTRVGDSIIVLVGEDAGIEYDRESAYALTKRYYLEDREEALNG
jgi:hypothetical protein